MCAQILSFIFILLARFNDDGEQVIFRDDFIQGAIMRSLDQHLTEDELIEMFSNVDISGDGELDLEEFLQMIADKINESNKIIEESVLAAFRVFDESGSGEFSVSDLRSLVTTLGDKLEPGEFDNIMKEADIEDDGKFNYSEFIRTLLIK
jgi:calmodulin